MGMVLEEAKTITSYMYSHVWTLNMMRKFTGGRELIRPRISRFVTDYLSLRAIVIQEDNLKNMFSHSECLSSMHRIRPEAQAIKSLLCQDRFWKSAHEAVSVSEPLIKILRIVDGDMPAMGYVYEGIEMGKGCNQGIL
ncbi:BINDING PROTEIN putative-RELATED [Salix koriyanagi]|uniref:BINDING PROTEIN putative-RELATED n=1 Tax=Salix koriyanagi TaxID=2511006 RepID=A0A9Q0Q7V7_9ROSI|nr:BINDING PROTEIN putative-RELATED [Salix koriyanagi]